MDKDKTSVEENKNNQNEIRITLQRDPQSADYDEEHDLATITVKLPAKFKTYKVVGVSHEVNELKDFYDNTDTWDWPIFSWDLRSSIERDFKDLLNISLINQKQNDSMFKLLSSTMREHADKVQEHSKNIREAKKNNTSSIEAVLEEN